MKKVNVLLASVTVALALTACGSQSKSNSTASSSQTSSVAKSKSVSFKSGTLKVPEGTIKINKAVIYDASDKSIDGKVYSAVVLYTFTNKSKSSVKPDDVFNKYLKIKEISKKQSKDLDTSAGLQLDKTPFDKLMKDANVGLNPGQTIKVAIPANTEKGHSNKFKIQAFSEAGDVIGEETVTAGTVKSNDFSTKPDTTNKVMTVGQTGQYGGYKLRVNSFKAKKSSVDTNIVVANVTLTNNTGSKIDSLSNDQFHLYDNNNHEIDVEPAEDSGLTDKVNDGVQDGTSVTGNVQWKVNDSKSNKYTLKFKPILTMNKKIIFQLNV